MWRRCPKQTGMRASGQSGAGDSPQWREGGRGMEERGMGTFVSNRGLCVGVANF